MSAQDSHGGVVQTYTQFAAQHGLVTDHDVQGHIHSGLMAAHMPRSYHRWYQKRLTELQAAREEGQNLYREAIARGDISPPKPLTIMEALELKASGDPDLSSTKAARRLLARMSAREGGAA